MTVKPEEITAVIKKEIESFDVTMDVKEIGYVLQVGDGIARVYGLENVMSSEMVKFSSDVYGVVLNLEEDNVGCVILGEGHTIKEGDVVERTGRILDVPVGDALLGRVVSPLGEPLDGAGPVETTQRMPIERVAPGVCDRQPVKEPLQTGIKCIDTMIPIGRGQRELIIGDRKTDRKSTRLNSSHSQQSRMPSSA